MCSTGAFIGVFNIDEPKCKFLIEIETEMSRLKQKMPSSLLCNNHQFYIGCTSSVFQILNIYIYGPILY